MYTPVNPSFTIYKWGVRGYKTHGHVILMVEYLEDIFSDDEASCVRVEKLCPEDLSTVIQ